MTKHPKEPPMRHCFYCGQELGRHHDHDPFDTCGKPECMREANYARDSQREEEEALERHEHGFRDY